MYELKPKIYIESSIISYCAARDNKNFIILGRQELTREWWNACKDHYQCYISQFVYDEISQGDPQAATKRLKFIVGIPFLKITDEIEPLADHLTKKILPANAYLDALHISIAAVNNITYLLTWNCKHIANAKNIDAIRKTIEEHNYIAPVICTPDLV